MTLAMMLGAGRGLVEEHEAFRRGDESWLDDRPETDFSLYRQTIGFIGFGQISRETHPKTEKDEFSHAFVVLERLTSA